MLRRILAVFGKKPLVVKGTAKLAEGSARKVTFGDPIAGTGYSIVFCRVDGTLHALDERCPHEGGRIMDGPLHEGREAVCPLHMYRFDPRDGSVTHGSCPRAKTYKVREVGDDCELWL